MGEAYTIKSTLDIFTNDNNQGNLYLFYIGFVSKSIAFLIRAMLSKNAAA